MKNNLIHLEDLMISFDDKKQDIKINELDKNVDEKIIPNVHINIEVTNKEKENFNENEKDFQIKINEPKNSNTSEATWIDKKLSFVSMKEWIDFQKTRWTKCTTIFIIFGDKVKSKLEVLSKHNYMFLK